MSGRTIATMLALMLMLAGSSAQAGALRAGTWVPTGCGAEPVPPAINGSSAGAYQSSIKDANLFEQAVKQYEDCYIKEAQADNHLISSAVSDHQHDMQAKLDKISADAKAAAARLNGKK